ncbi:MAG: aminofutalosine synthase MqnE [Bacteroidota bacterium]|nr:aminofutalosine synthase MqnE [Bacteroidota bacterium]
MKYQDSIQSAIKSSDTPSHISQIAEKIFSGKRISDNEALILYKEAELSLLAVLATHVKERKNGKNVYFNRNFHIEPTNICIYSCKFCSYARKQNQDGAWEYTIDEILEKAESYKGSKVTEVHIVGGVHPKRDLHYYGNMMSEIKKILPDIHIKAFTAVELEFMIKRAKLPIDEGLRLLKDYGLDSIPGGGAEIFDSEIRKQLCDEKASTDMWLNIHKAAHREGLPSNATILYGHIESYEHRIDHMKRLRNLQDETHGFNTFIPLKFRKENNLLSYIGEISAHEDLRNYAVSRLYLDNFNHIKAYWPGIGKSTAQASLAFGVDDVDGTIDDSTKIYSLAGAEDQNPKMNTAEIVELIKQAGQKPTERDTLYNVLKNY